MPKVESELSELYRRKYDELYQKHDKLKKELLNVCKKNEKCKLANTNFYKSNGRMKEEIWKLRNEVGRGINELCKKNEEIKLKDKKIRELEGMVQKLLLKDCKENRKEKEIRKANEEAADF